MLQYDPKNRPCISEIMKSDFFTFGYMPKKLPPSCLTMAPRFDSINYRESISNRKPLIGKLKNNFFILNQFFNFNLISNDHKVFVLSLSSAGYSYYVLYSQLFSE